MSSFEAGFHSTYYDRNDYYKQLESVALEDFYPEQQRHAFASLSPFFPIGDKVTDAVWTAANTGDADAQFVLGVVARNEVIASARQIEAVPGYLDPVVIPPVKKPRLQTVMDFEIEILEAENKVFQTDIVKPAQQKIAMDRKTEKVAFDKA